MRSAMASSARSFQARVARPRTRAESRASSAIAATPATGSSPKVAMTPVSVTTALPVVRVASSVVTESCAAEVISSV
jgi:hypothetical protein